MDLPIPPDLRDAVERGAERAFRATEQGLEETEKGEILAEALLQLRPLKGQPEAFIIVAVEREVEEILGQRESLPHDGVNYNTFTERGKANLRETRPPDGLGQ